MKTGLLSVLLLLTPSAFGQDGFYTREANGQQGTPVRLTVKTAYVVSQNNLNTRFQAAFSTLEKNSPNRAILVVGVRRFDLRGGTGLVDVLPNSTPETVYDFDAGSIDDARAVAAFLGAKLHLREHPGHRLNTTFATSKSVYSPGEAVTVIMTITNVGTTPVRLRIGGMDRGTRNNQFAFSLIHANTGVPDTGNAANFGGFVTAEELKPGESFKKTSPYRCGLTPARPVHTKEPALSRRR